MSKHASEIADGQRFAFGDNWRQFLERLTPRRIAEAERSLSEMLEVENLAGRSFLDIGSGSGLFSAKREALTADALLNGLPVTIKTLQPADGAGSGVLMASQVTFRRTDFKTANMIRHATDQRFAEQAAATEALRGRVGDIDKYNIKNTINVHFDTGKAELSAQDKANLCATATSAEATENALLLVVGYTDSTGENGSASFTYKVCEAGTSTCSNTVRV